MLAIQLLGDLHSRSAIPAFRSIIQDENDFYVIREIVRSLRKIGGKDSEELLSALSKHKSKLIRDLVVQK
jgi:HEAT repeat protein